MTAAVKSAPLIAVADKPAAPSRRRKTAKPNPLLLLPIVLMLRELLERNGEITIRLADLDELGFLGLTDFVDRTIDLSHTLDEAEFRWTLVHELLHHLYGPSASGARESRTTGSRPALQPCCSTPRRRSLCR